MEKTHVVSTSKGEITLSTGKMGLLSAGAVKVQKGNTVLLATADTSAPRDEMDFFPLTIEYLERYSAVGTLSGSRFNKREGFPNEEAIITARQVDHTIRPMFPKGFKQPTNVILTLLSSDGEVNPEELTVLGASAALMISGLPFQGPAASVIVSVNKNEGIEVNSEHAHDDSELLGHFVVSGTKDRILNVEGWGKELSDDMMDSVLDAALAYIRELCDGQLAFAEGFAKQQVEVQDDAPAKELVNIFYEKERGRLEEAMYVSDKQERDAKLTAFLNSAIEQYQNEEEGITAGKLRGAIDYVEKKILRENVLSQSKRLSGRGLDEIRHLAAEVDVLPNNVHGSALFTRGYTQSLSMVTLGSTAKSVGFDDMKGVDTVKGFMHHYNFPPFSVGEAGRVSYRPGRREIGHGNIGENALKHMIPSQDDFPYTVRAVSEIMTSNGSTSMAATCASSMALMAAGVPMKAAVAGIGVGLVTGDDAQNDYRLLLDIEGVEDFFGDMDFKVTGTRKGMTAIQFETKLNGVRPEILKEAFRLANNGRQQVLDVMDSAISASREQLSPSAPRVETLTIPTDRIGELIGPGGKVIKGIVADSTVYGPEAEIDINDDGRVSVTAHSKEQIDFIKSKIRLIMEGPQEGEVYDADVVSIMDYGAFVDIGYGIQGLVHISEIDGEKRVNKVEDYLKLGDRVRVKLIEKKQGRNSFSIKAAKE